MFASGNIRAACRSARGMSQSPYAWVSVVLSLVHSAHFDRDLKPSRRGFSIAWPRNLRHGPVKSQQRYMGPQHRVIRLCQAISTVARLTRSPVRDIAEWLDRRNSRTNATAAVRGSTISTEWGNPAPIGERQVWRHVRTIAGISAGFSVKAPSSQTTTREGGVCGSRVRVSSS